MDNPQANPKKLYVGNISYSTTEDQLRELFGEHGEIVDVKLIVDRFSGRSRGIAFVEFTTEEQAQAAIEALHESELDGRQLVVNVARPRKPREDRRGGGGGYNRGGGNNRF